MKRYALLAVVSAFVAATPAVAAPPTRSWVPAGLDEQQSSAHFLVHYTTAEGDPNALADPSQITAMLDRGEQALAFYGTQLGFVPVDDGDGKIDIYVFAVSANAGAANGYTRADHNTPSTSSAIAVRGDRVSNLHTIVHELFHVMQLATYRYHSHWFAESTADWASYAFEDAGSRLRLYTHPEVSLDCQATTFAGGCACDGYGYGRWPYWETLRETYGLNTLREVFAKEAALGQTDHMVHEFEAIDAALAGHGSDLVDTYFDTVELMTGGAFTLKGLAGAAPVPVAQLATGSANAVLSQQTLTVDHLAARYVRFASGPAQSGTPCRTAKLTIAVTLPAGIASRPVWARRGERGQALAVSGSTASVTLPWRTCSGLDGRLGVPNGARDAAGDGATFVVQSALAVDADEDETDPPAVPPVLLSAAAPGKVRLARRGKTRFVVTVQSSATGMVDIVVTSAKRDFADPDWYLDVPDRAIGFSVNRRLRRGLNRLAIAVPHRFRPKRAFVVLTPFTADADATLGKTTVRRVKFKKPQHRAGR